MIKKFEEFNPTGDFFEIGLSEYDAKKTIPLDPKFKPMLKSQLGNNWYLFDSNKERIDINGNKLIRYVIWWCEDEWFYVFEEKMMSDNSRSWYEKSYYKCDQWDGLISLLTSKGVIGTDNSPNDTSDVPNKKKSSIWRFNRFFAK